MILEIISPEKIVFTGEVSSVAVPGVDGEFEMLNNHAPIISILEKGHIKVVDNNNEEKLIEINGGSIEMSHNKITILAQES